MDEALEISAETPAKQTPNEQVNILLVDDRADKLLAMQSMLAGLEQNIVSASSGKDALRCLLRQDFAVILLDVNMPVMDGFDTATLIRQRPKSETTPIIFVSADNDAESHLARGYSLGAVDYIVTPVLPEILRAKVAFFVDLYRKNELIKRQVEERSTLLREQEARVTAEAEQDRLAFLADAGNVLAGSLEHDKIVRNVARLIVPKLADYCVVEMLDGEGKVGQVAVAHRDPQVESELRAMRKKCSDDLRTLNGSERGFRAGDVGRLTGAGDGILSRHACSEEYFQLVKAMGITGSIVAPMRGRERILGIISLFSASSERVYGAAELSLAEAFAQRAVLALENAALYGTAKNAQLSAERANKAKDEFLAMLSHELRTPLSPVLTTVLALEEDEQTPQNVRAPLGMIRRNVELEARLIDDLLDLTRISKGKLQLNLECVDAHQLLRNALEICAPDFTKKNLELETNFHATQFQLQADPARLQQIFWNLIKNAVKFTPAGGRISVVTQNGADEELQVEVIDTGVGIAEEALPNIFNAFEQAEATPRMGGLGLGLAITKTLVDLHHGSIVAESAGPDQGAKFTATFPTVPETQKLSTSETAPPAKDGDRRSARILLVEDHPDTNEALTRMLQRRGYEVLSTVDVKSALATASSRPFDVLVSDMGLPDGSGLDVMRNLKSKGNAVFGIAVSGFGMEADIRKSLAAGFRHHLIKPVDVNRLDALIQQS